MCEMKQLQLISTRVWLYEWPSLLHSWTQHRTKVETIVTIMCHNYELGPTMSWVGCLQTDLVLPDTWKIREWKWQKFCEGFGYFLQIMSLVSHKKATWYVPNCRIYEYYAIFFFKELSLSSVGCLNFVLWKKIGIGCMNIQKFVNSTHTK